MNKIPPHWSKGIIEQHGSRSNGPGMTIDSRIVAGSPPRLTGTANPRYKAPTPSPRIQRPKVVTGGAAAAAEKDL
jgi:hypothetical protein